MVFIKPTIVVSKCLGFENCRYNGGSYNNNFINKLKNHTDIIVVCPEVEIGLGTPREPIRIVFNNDLIKVIQHKTNKDVTDDLTSFSKNFIEKLSEVDGFILKSKSPSCGVGDVKLYPSENIKGTSKKGNGIFSHEVTKTFPDIPIETDGRLTDSRIREHFLTKLFTNTEFKEVKKLKSLDKLIDFQDKNNLLFTVYNKTRFKNMKTLLSSNNFDDFINEYEKELNLLFARSPRYTSNISLFRDIYLRFEGNLIQSEKDFIESVIIQYSEGKVPLSVPLYLLKSFAIRFEDNEILSQSYFNPYPEDLIDTTTYRHI